MPHCTKCGTAVAENATFCPSCGAQQGAGISPAAPSSAQSGLAQNTAGALCYVLGWLTGLIFFLTDKRPYVRFHAAQSIVVFGGLQILSFIVARIFGIGLLFGGWGSLSIGVLLYELIHLGMFVLWIVLMIKAYQGDKFRVPIAADAAESIFGKSA
jgi:uncharacterized membrane protein